MESPVPDIDVWTARARSRSSLTDTQVVRAARLLVDSLVGNGSWVRRRVERVSFAEGEVMRSVAIDYDSPDGDDQIPIPVALLDKSESHGVLTAGDERGRQLPLLTREESGAIALVALRLAIVDADGRPGPESEQLLAELVVGSERVAAAAWSRILQQAPPWIDAPAVRTLCRTLQRSWLCCVVARADAQRHLVRVTWTSRIERHAKAFPARMPWRSANLAVSAGSALPGPGSYHFELTAPPGLRITDCRALDSDAAPVTGWTRIDAPTQRLHRYTRSLQPSQVQLLVRMRPRRLALDAALTSAMLLVAIGVVVWFIVGGRSDAVVALLVAPLSVVAYAAMTRLTTVATPLLRADFAVSDSAVIEAEAAPSEETQP